MVLRNIQNVVMKKQRIGQLIERHTHEVRARYQEMGSVVAQAQEDFSARLSELKDRQDQLIEMVQRLQHKIDAS